MSQTYIEQSLSKDEILIMRFELGLAGKVKLYTFFLLIPLTLGVLYIYEHYRLKNLEYALTNRRLVFKEGIFSCNTSEIKLESTETIELRQSVWGKIFGYGTIKITGKGDSLMYFQDVKYPIEVKMEIESVIAKNTTNAS